MTADTDCVITRFYDAFSRRDHAAMGACYTDDVVFSDPVFPRLVGDEARRMWRMLCERGTDLELTFKDVVHTGSAGSAHWEARYTFSATGRPVHNIIAAKMTLSDGLISAHTDTFSFYRWARMALGAPGILLGWTPMLKQKVRRMAAKGLSRFEA